MKAIKVALLTLVLAASFHSSAVEAGELDSQIEEASNTLRKGFGK